MKPRPVLYLAAVCIGFFSLFWIYPDPPQANSENSQNPSFISPVELKQVTKTGKGYTAFFKMLDYNPSFSPGNNENFYIQYSSELNTAEITTVTKFYTCGLGPDENFTTPDVPDDITVVLAEGKGIYSFDVEMGKVVSVMEECLP